MGKHSDTIITVNRNTYCQSEDCLVDCLSSVIINEAELNDEINIDNFKDTYYDEEMARIQSDVGSDETYDIPLENIDVLDQFESHVSN